MHTNDPLRHKYVKLTPNSPPAAHIFRDLHRVDQWLSDLLATHANYERYAPKDVQELKG